MKRKKSSKPWNKALTLAMACTVVMTTLISPTMTAFAAAEDPPDVDEKSDTRYSVEIVKSEHGTVKASSDTYKEGETVSLTVEPEVGYEVKNLQVQGKASGATYSVPTKNGKVQFGMPAEDIKVLDSFTMTDDEKSVAEVKPDKSVETQDAYILEHADPKYVEKDKLTPFDMILVKQTFANKAGFGSDAITLDNLYRDDDGDGFADYIAERFIGQTDTFMPLWSSDKSEYMVAHIDTANADSEIAQVLTAKNNDKAEMLNDVIFDKETGLIYVPKKYAAFKTVADGTKKADVSDVNDVMQFGQVRAQILYAMSGKQETTANVVIHEKGVRGDVASTGIATFNVTDQSVSVRLAEDEKARSAMSEKTIDSVLLNGVPLQETDYEYDRETGVLILNADASGVDSVEITLSNTLKKSVSSTFVSLFGATKAQAARYTLTMASQNITTGSANQVFRFKTAPVAGEWYYIPATEYAWHSNDGHSTIVNNNGVFGLVREASDTAAEPNMAAGTGATPKTPERTINFIWNNTLNLTLSSNGYQGTWLVNGWVGKLKAGTYGSGNKNTASAGNGKLTIPAASRLFSLACAHTGIATDHSSNSVIGINLNFDRQTDYDYQIDTNKVNLTYGVHVLKVFPNSAGNGGTLILGIVTPTINTQAGVGYVTATYELDGGGIKIVKESANPNVTNNNSYYSLAGASFTLTGNGKTYTGTTTGTGTSASVSFDNIPAGTYTLTETKAPKGYQTMAPQTVTIKNGVNSSANSITVKDAPHMPQMQLKKVSSDPTLTTNNCNYDLAGAQYKITSVATGEEQIVTTNAKGIATFDALPLGQYKVQEIKTPNAGYVLNDEVQTVTVDENTIKNGIIEVTSVEECLIDPIGIILKKQDPTTGEGIPQGDGSLAGAVFHFTVYEDPTLTDEQIKAGTDAKVLYEFDATTKNNNGFGQLKLTKDAISNFRVVDGNPNAKLDDFYSVAGFEDIFAFPLSTVNVSEKSAPNGYFCDTVDFAAAGPSVAAHTSSNNSYTFNITDESIEANNNRVLSVMNQPGDEVIANESHSIYGDVQITKYDAELNRSESVNKADGTDLSGIQFDIVNKSNASVIVGDQTYEPDDVVTTITTHWNEEKKAYTAETTGNMLPYGTYEVREKAANKYYTVSKKTLTFSIRNDGTTETKGTDGKDLIFSDQIKRSDVKFKKLAETTQTGMSTAWVLENQATGERHVIVTDANGNFDSSKNAHSANTNKNDALLANIDAKKEIKMEDADMTSGIWFGSDAVNDDLGALPYGHYTMTEVRSDSNYGFNLKSTELYVYEDGDMIALDDIIDNEMHIGTVLLENATNAHMAKAEDGMKLTDTVSYTNLDDGKEYTMKGTLVEKETGAVLAEGKTDFTAKADGGTVKVAFDLDAAELAGKSVVAYEEVIEKDTGLKIADHTSREDEEQTVHFPGVETTATDAVTGAHTGKVEDTVTVIDRVAYSNLLTGKEYTVTGTLMDKATGKALTDKDGKKFTATAKFTAEQANGTVDITFTVPGELVSGKSVVAFESLEENKVEVGVHADINDEDQTVYYPSVGTTATAGSTGTHAGMLREDAVIHDEVAYKGLQPGTTYTLHGVLMNKATNEPLVDHDGNTVKVDKEFTPLESDGTVTISFAFNSLGLDGVQTVAFETVTLGDHEVAAHTDIKDKNQTVSFPKIGTTLTDKKTETHEALAEDTITLTDVVKYEGLIAGKEHTVKGVLMDKKTGESLKDENGVEMTAETTFTPEESSGEVTVTFTVPGSICAGKTLVAFETMKMENLEVAIHADIEDEDQTVTVPKIGTTLVEQNSQMHIAPNTDSVTLVDTIAYENLIPGKNYEAVGTLMDKATGEPITVDDKPVTAKASFTPDEANGTVEVVFTFNAAALDGKDVVAFETVSRDGNDVAVHTDIEDENQTVHFPKVGTTAVVGTTGTHMMDESGKTQVLDTVKYEGLLVGETYKVSGTLMDKQTGEALLVDGNPVTAETTFVPEAPEGETTVLFEFDGKYAGKTLVAFEEITCNGALVAQHKDIDDEEQSVHGLDIGTTLTGRDGKAKTVDCTSKAELTDTVQYKNLVPGQEYTITGWLVKKSDGSILTGADGKECKVTTTFTPETADGTTTVTFTADVSKLDGEKIVAFEEVYDNDVLIGSHKDLEDEGQTVLVQTRYELVTGIVDNANLLAGIAMAMLLVTVIGTVVCRRRRMVK